MTATDKSLRIPRRLPRPRTWRGWLGAAAAILFMIVAIAWGLSRATPSWYQPLDPNESWVIDDMTRGQNAVFDFNNFIQRVPLGRQTWSITQDEVNSLLAQQFAPPAGSAAGTRPAAVPIVSAPFVLFSPGRVTISARSSRIPGSDPRGGVGTLVYSVGIINDGQGNPQGLVRLRGAWVGLLPVPASVVDSRVQALAPAIMPAVMEALALQPDGRTPRAISADRRPIVQAVLQGQAFSLCHRIDGKQLIIEQIKVDRGLFTLVIAPPPAVIASRPVN